MEKTEERGVECLTDIHQEELRGWPSLAWDEEPIRALTPLRSDIWRVRLLSVLGMSGLVVLWVRLLDPEIRGEPWFYWPILVTLSYRMLWWAMEWVNYIRPKVEPHAPCRRDWKVDVLTTACPGEPRGMILRTLAAMVSIRYPHTNYLCDEGDDPVLKEACLILGVKHVTRKQKTQAKAGNINNALAQATGDIVVVLDPDHEPAPFLLDRVLGHFENPLVGFVQSVQAYRNQGESYVADGAAKQTYLFYGPLMIGMNAYGTTQAIGANCVFRRAALDSIGGHSAGLSEDMHTTMRLYAKGWRSVYVPEILTRGLVPSSLSAFCKQQLKWACGSMELLLQEYPKLFRGMTHWQRVHYILAPVYFLRGFTSAIDIVVPILCLFSGGTPLRMNPLEFSVMYAAVLLVASIIRQHAQRWVIEEQDRGAHFIGGILAKGCWWVYMQGALSAICGIKLPYIPTPKDNEVRDSWSLAIPNVIASVVSLAAVIYGLRRDFSPYTWAMAGFACMNIAQLLWVAALGQQQTLSTLRKLCPGPDQFWSVRNGIQSVYLFFHGAILRVLRQYPTVLGLSVCIGGLGAYGFSKTGLSKNTEGPAFKDTGGFYLGVDFGESGKKSLAHHEKRAQEALGAPLALYPLTQGWCRTGQSLFPLEAMRAARLKGAVPLITWVPETDGLRELVKTVIPLRREEIFTAVNSGAFDEYLGQCARVLRDFGEPVLICLAPGADVAGSAWSSLGADSGEIFAMAWDYIVELFHQNGASNVGWVWQPGAPTGFQTHMPTATNIDWLALPPISPKQERLGKVSFESLYKGFREPILETHLPVLLMGLEMSLENPLHQEWMRDALLQISAKFPEIRGLVLRSDNLDAAAESWFANPSVPGVLERASFTPPVSSVPRADLWAERSRTALRSSSIRVSGGSYELMVDEKPFYVRGVAYNPGQDWRDGNIPLTRREIDFDLARVRELGANTLRRYEGNLYDRNLLRGASEAGLKVLYGFGFKSTVDYCREERLRAKQRSAVLAKVRASKNESAILGWGLGNQVWGPLKREFSQPYLTEVRHSYVDFIQDLALQIHAIDPARPVYAVNEHSAQLAGCIADFARGAPALDFTGVNSYYESRISKLKDIIGQFDGTRPYLVSEFGPDGYWDKRTEQRNSRGALLEPLSSAKRFGYERGWSVHTEAHQGANIGGIAYCWRDRYEATATWFGLSDRAGRLKPAGAALKRLWTGAPSNEAPIILGIDGPLEPVAAGSSVRFRAKVAVPDGEKMTCHWRLSSDRWQFSEIAGRSGGTKNRINFTAPSKPGRYRIYVSVHGLDTVDEASFPLDVVSLSAPGQSSGAQASEAH